MDFLLNLDNQLFVLINQQLASPTLSSFFSTFTDFHKVSWVQYFLAPVLLLWWLKRKRLKVVPVLLAMLIVAGVSDLVCYRGIKQLTFRPRPWVVEELNPVLRVEYGPKSSSFPSNHASTTTALATLLSWYYPALIPVFASYAFLTAYSRVYVGVHYPLDVAAGILIGMFLAGLLIVVVFQKLRFFRR